MWLLIHSNHCFRMRMARYLVRGQWSPALAQASLNPFWQSHHLRVLKHSCSSLLPSNWPQLDASIISKFLDEYLFWPDLFPGSRIDDRKSAKPRMRGFLHGSKIIAQERGIRGFFQGFVPTTARQAANSATRFSSYTTLKQFAESYVAPGEKLGTLSTFAIGGMAGLITV